MTALHPDEVFLAAMERKLVRGPSWRANEYPRPGDLYQLLDPTAVDTPALRMLDDHLVDVATGARHLVPHGRLAVSIGPQEGKSQRISRTFPLWLLLRNPDTRVIVLSYQDDIARRWGRQVRNDITLHSGAESTTDLHLRVRRDTSAADRWELEGHRGGMVTAGMEGAITGRPADIVVIDDPYKNKQTARSRVIRERVRDTWKAVVVPRLAAGAPVVVLHTRWHEDDLIGWLMAEQGDLWTYLNIPALAAERDPLGRAPGEWLESARGRTPAQWEQTRREVGEYDFAALYQGSPQPAAGGLFKRQAFRYWQPTSDPWTVEMPGGRLFDCRTGWRFATVDLAASTKTSADWTVAAVWCVNDIGQLILLDLVRAQADPEQHWDLVRPFVERWDTKLYIEASQWGTDLVYTAGREGAALDRVSADTDKFTRAIPAARKIGQGTVFFPARAHWVPELLDELVEFPNGAHDDQVDVVAYASRVVSEVWFPGMLNPPLPLARNGTARRSGIDAAGGDDFDPLGVQF
jgi:predicted phage terminase large subunit-like protein